MNILSSMPKLLRRLTLAGAMFFIAFVGRVDGVVNCLPPPPGLAAWWPLQSNAVDMVGGHNGTLTEKVS